MNRYKDPTIPVEDRVEDLLSRMTLQEKCGQLNEKIYGWDAYRIKNGDYEITEGFAEEVALGDGVGGLYGLFRADPWSGVTFANGAPMKDNARLANLVQRYVLENTRLGIPVLICEECPHGHQALDSTLFPTSLGQAATFNPDLYEEAFSHVAAELRSRGANVGMVSLLDLLRDPRWGRSEETFGEDPHLAAAMCAAAVRGLQGRNSGDAARPDRVAALVKCFAAHGGSEGGHNAKGAILGERELREIHFPPMQAAARAGALGCMAAYNEIDGVLCHGNPWLLTTVLREEMGFEGLVMSDGVAIDNLVPLAGSYEGAAAMALRAGVDLNLQSVSYTRVLQAVLTGQTTEELVERAVRRILRVKFLLGLFENPFTDEEAPARMVGGRAARHASLQTARECAVLLKNEGAVLPIGPSVNRIALIGPHADSLYNLLGDYTPPQRLENGVTILQGLRAIAPDGVTIQTAHGCGIRDVSRDGFAEAVSLARDSDLVVLALGGSSTRDFDVKFSITGAAIPTEKPAEMDCGEGMDVAHLRLGGVQEQLAATLATTGKPIVTVLIMGRPHAIPAIVDSSRAVLCAWYPGPQGGTTIAEILFGRVNPSGRLPASLPRSSGQLPIYYNHRWRNDYVDLPATPLFPFGFGLSYTTFEYSNMRIDPPRVSAAAVEAGERVRVRVDVANNGSVAGQEVVTLYTSARLGSVTRRVKELKGFAKVGIAPGEKKTLELGLGFDELFVWNNLMKAVVEPTDLTVTLGQDGSGISQVLKITK